MRRLLPYIKIKTFFTVQERKSEIKQYSDDGRTDSIENKSLY